VLVVDPSPAARAAVRRMIRSSRGFRLVGEVPDVAEATLATARLRPALVLLEVDLPDGSGVAAGRWMRRLTPPPLVLLYSAAPESAPPLEVLVSGLPYVTKADLAERSLDALLPPTASAVSRPRAARAAAPSPARRRLAPSSSS
jgi:DNA-binding NarL/FixJ family response regulator